MAIQVNTRGQATKIPNQRTRPTKIKINKRGKLAAKIIAGSLLFFLAVGIGHSQGVKDASHTPDSQTLGILHYAEKMGAKGCRAEWNDTYHSYEVVCSKPVQLTNLDADNDPQH